MSDSTHDRDAARLPDPGRRRVVLGAVAAAVGGMAFTDPASAAPPGLAPASPPESPLTEPSPIEVQNEPGYYPPTRQGMRGSHPGSFESAHALRDGLTLDHAARVDADYDLVIVGGGISGLAAAHFYGRTKPRAHILILENHDDFGGHAKRNEIEVDGRMLLLNGGTMLIDSPRAYSRVAAGLLEELGIRPAALDQRYHPSSAFTAAKLRRAAFFGKEAYSRDVLVTLPEQANEYRNTGGDAGQWSAAVRDAPLSDEAKAGIVRVEAGTQDYFPTASAGETMDRLSRMSYRRYLEDVVKVNREVLDYYQAATHGEFGLGIDAEPALDCWGIGLPGFTGLKMDHRITARMGNTAAGYSSTGGSPSFHFPDGNATIARALVRALIPPTAPRGSIEDLVTARFDYGQLDRPDNRVRIRLNSTVVNVKRRATDGVDVSYVQGGSLRAIRARHCVLAGYNMMIPKLVPELPETQKAALHALVKVPLVYTTVALRNWRAFKALGISGAHCPGGFFSSFQLVPGPDIGHYTGPRSPDDPIVARMLRVPCQPGAPTERDQHRAGRRELLETSLAVFETHVRDQLGRALGPGGFDAGKDIAAIIVNRWPHGYAYEYNPLFDPWDVPESARPHVIGRQPFGPIAIANSDAGAAAYTDCAIDQAHRAVAEILAS